MYTFKIFSVNGSREIPSNFRKILEHRIQEEFRTIGIKTGGLKHFLGNNVKQLAITRFERLRKNDNDNRLLTRTDWRNVNGVLNKLLDDMNVNCTIKSLRYKVRSAKRESRKENKK